MNSLTIVTINNGNLEELFQTLDSIDSQNENPFQNIIIASNIDDNKKRLIDKSYKKNYREFLFDLDTSIYNAMNIGVENANGSNIIFLNSGDVFFNMDSIAKIKKAIANNNQCHSFRIAQYYKNDIYIRPGIKKINTWGHSGFVAPLENNHDNRILFNENRSISADGDWMKVCQELYGIDTHLDVITKFKLGGVSSNPSIKTILMQKNNASLKSFIKEIIKLIIITLLGNKKYYIFIGKINKYDKIDLEN